MALILLVSMFSLTSCKKKEPVPAKVTGFVTLDQGPLPTGKILLYSGAGEVPVTVMIQNGHFEASLPPGNYRVEIMSYKPIPNAPKPTAMVPHDQEANFLPARYNTQTEFSIQVNSGESKEVKYDLVSDKTE